MNQGSNFCPGCGTPNYIANNTAIPASYVQNQVAVVEANMGLKAESHHSRTAIMLLCLFLGGLGVHRFVSGRVGLGLMHLFALLSPLIVWGFAAATNLRKLSSFLVMATPALILINGIWTFIEWIMALCGSLEDSEGNFISRW